MNIAVVGATGLVGREIIKILNQKDLLNNNNLYLFASKKSANKKIKINNKQYKIMELNEENFNKFKYKINYALFSAGSEVSKNWACRFAECGIYVIDNSSAFRRDKTVPLIVPEINGNLLKRKNEKIIKNQAEDLKKLKKSDKNIQFGKIIANPNCSTIGLSLPLFCLQKTCEIKKIIVSTYQAVSGAGQKGIQDLKNSTTKKFTNVIANNLIPQIDYALDNGYTYEEDKMNFELKKILNDKRLKISTTCVRVPVLNCHSESVYVEFFNAVNVNKIVSNLKKFKGIKVVNDLSNGKYPMPILCDGKDDVYIGRIRQDTTSKKAISFFISFDNIRKGASLNAVQILECLMKNEN